MNKGLRQMCGWNTPSDLHLVRNIDLMNKGLRPYLAGLALSALSIVGNRDLMNKGLRLIVQRAPSFGLCSFCWKQRPDE